MFKRYLMVLTMLLALPAFANAWYVNAKTSPSIGSGTISPSGTKAFASFSTARGYTVNPAAGKKISRVTVDGVLITPTAGKYDVPYASGKAYRYIVAYFAAADTALFSITPTVVKDTSVPPQARGTIREDNFQSLTKIPAGSARQILVIPNTGYTVGAITASGTPVRTDNFNGSTATLLVYNNINANITVNATFLATTVVTANAGQNVQTTGTDVANAATLFGSGSTNQSGATLTYAWTGTGLVFGDDTAASTTVYSATPGTYTATLTVTSSVVGTTPATDTAQVAVVDRAAYLVNICAGCHNDSTPLVIAGFNSTTAPGHMNSTNLAPEVKTCATCHSAAPHARNADCIGCHTVGQNAGANFVQDNNGVRAIVGEFAKRSHHVTGKSVTNADCAVCHLEGKRVGGDIVVDTDYHMKDTKTYLRNGNLALGQTPDKSFGAGYAWDPATPDHTLMDQFCFSCHNAAGAPAAVNIVAGNTALNPFNDSVSNSYDQVSRVNVVGVYEQFDTGNSSHHAVRGAKYTLNNLTPAMFTNISTANAAALEGGVSKPQKGVKVITGTMFELGKFTPTYTTLNNEVLADNNVLHCGDCHTVGQFRAVDVGVEPFNNAVIGAHGSENEYMLRNANGDDVFAKDALVCYICHNPTKYGVASGDHNSVNGSNLHCDSEVYNSGDLVGLSRLVPEERYQDGFTDEEFQHEVSAGTYQATGGGNIFGNKCLNCHNASDKKTFGGIHGNAGNASYVTYSGAKTVSGVVTTVNRKPYRFLPGLGNFRYNGGDSAEQWTVKVVSQANKQGCYTLNGTSATRGGVGNQPTQAVASGINTGGYNAATGVMGVNGVAGNDNGLLGSWGACTDHAGTSVFGGRATTRSLLRPLTY